jgi:hypothetical protein
MLRIEWYGRVFFPPEGLTPNNYFTTFVQRFNSDLQQNLL